MTREERVIRLGASLVRASVESDHFAPFISDEMIFAAYNVRPHAEALLAVLDDLVEEKLRGVQDSSFDV